ncbi:MAG: DUF58 domain-containing protein, partial [Myxococcota bacterium]|nr:DUF58 domain-containing protein [Myxococcota bacterium]
MDLRELRDHQPGDPFKHIAWAATARRRKLTSRVYESDIRRSTWIVLDVSPSMFWGQPGTSRIDYGMEAAFQLTNLLLERGERVGLMIHDERVRLQVAPGAGRSQHHRVVRALLEVACLYHEDRTEVTHRELLDAVGGWFASQEGRRYRLPM